ncbi:DivIVA domain-containing protein [Micromonospora musae]|uniref:DivIVA domain-containing protein n=1 Tax=Micromonospora musae TaxID=1894970 RepID=A0ABX9RFR6_9ACTN|nr:DivIVA domain-containing protein [Micromonospora musae]
MPVPTHRTALLSYRSIELRRQSGRVARGPRAGDPPFQTPPPGPSALPSALERIVVAQVYRGGQPYPAGYPGRLTPHEVRTREFAARRRGVDPDEVREFQARMADELATLNETVRLLSQENDRVKRALRDWQTMHARECRPVQEFRPNPGHW